MGPTNPQGAVPEMIPDIRKPDYQLLMQDLAQARREVFEERRNGDKRVNEERDRARWETDRVRTEFSDRIRKAERENDALITALGRLRQENDSLREEVAVLKIGKSNGQVETKTQAEPEAPKAPSQRLLVSMVPPSEPALGKAVSIDPAKLG